MASAAVQGAWLSVVSDQPLAQAIISNTPATGTIAVPFTFIGSNSTADTWAWTFLSVPAGSVFTVGSISYPDNGATAPINMTSNEVLYHANETSGAIGTDTSGNGNNATLTNATVGAAGKIGTAWQNTSAIRVTPASSVVVGTDWTLSLWYYSVKPSGFAAILYHAFGILHALVNNSTGELGVYSGSFLGSGAFVTRGEAVWRHLAVVGTGGNTLFYIDGALAGTTGYQITGDVVTIAGDPFNQYFAERVDEVAIWSRALSASEIEDIYNFQNGGIYSTAQDFTFTPDVNGVYTVQLTVAGYDFGNLVTDSTTGVLTLGALPAAGIRTLPRGRGPMTGPAWSIT